MCVCVSVHVCVSVCMSYDWIRGLVFLVLALNKGSLSDSVYCALVEALKGQRVSLVQTWLILPAPGVVTTNPHGFLTVTPDLDLAHTQVHTAQVHCVSHMHAHIHF